MKKCKKRKIMPVRAAAFGLDKLNTADLMNAGGNTPDTVSAGGGGGIGVSGAAGIANAATSAFDATGLGTDSETGGPNALGVASGAIGGAATGALSGAALGAQLGSTAGPIGMAAGAVIGLLGGLFSGIRKKKKAERALRRKKTLEENKLGESYEASLEAKYAEENDPVSTFAYGGLMPSDLAYVDNNEILRDVNGNINQVPNTKPGTDNHLINATGLESVLSDKLKRPGTNKTFAQEGEKLARMTKPSKNNDRFAENTNKLNKLSANRKYNQLLNEQEIVKKVNGIKPKYKGIPAYESSDRKTFWNRPLGDYIDRLGEWAMNLDWSKGMTIKPGPSNGRTYLYKAPAKFAQTPDIQVDDYTPELKAPTLATKATASSAPAGSSLTALTVTKTRNTVAPTADTANTKSANIPEFANTPYLSVDDPIFELKAPALPDSDNTTSATSTANSPKGKGAKYIDEWLSLAPVMYNAIQGIHGPELEDLNYNPYAGNIRRTMSKRKYNIQPLLEANRKNRAYNRYNAARLNANTGSNLAFNLQNASNERRANAEAWGTKQNMDNQYAADYANTLNNLGQQWVSAKNLYDDLNARNRAKARDFTGTALSQLGQWSQTKTRSRNEWARDQQMMPYLQEFLKSGYSSDIVDQWAKSVK